MAGLVKEDAVILRKLDQTIPPPGVSAEGSIIRLHFITGQKWFRKDKNVYLAVGTLPFRILVTVELPHHLESKHQNYNVKRDRSKAANETMTYLCSRGATASLWSWKSWNTLEGNAK